MRYQTLYGFYWFGTCLRFLQDASEHILIHGDGRMLWNLGRFFEHLDELGLAVTRRHAESKLSDLMKELSETDANAGLTDGQAARLREAVQGIRDTLEAEIIGIGAYTPTPKRLDLQRLLEDVGALFAPDTFDILPEIARFDLIEAGKCIAFERPTAAAFHILRSTEAILRFYYTKMIRSGRINSLMWGPIVADLRKRQLTKQYDTLNNHLDNIRSSFRNPTQHPEATYDIHEVQDLWSVCVDVINRMIKIMRKEARL